MRIYLCLMVLQACTDRRTGSSSGPGQEQRVLLDGAPADLMVIPRLAFQCVFTSLDPTTVSKPSFKDHTAWHPNHLGYVQVVALDMLLQLGQILSFHEEFVTMSTVRIKRLSINRVCAALKVVLDLRSATSNNVTASKPRHELGVLELDFRSVRQQLNALSQGLLKMEETLRSIHAMVKNRPILKNANIRGFVELWKSQRETKTNFLLPGLLRQDTMQTATSRVQGFGCAQTQSPGFGCRMISGWFWARILPYETTHREMIVLFLPACQIKQFLLGNCSFANFIFCTHK